MISRFFFALLVLLCLGTPAQAVEAPHNTQARLFSAVKGIDELKTVPLGVEVTLNPGWKAYWRTPGEAGLAPVFNWSGSSNLKSAAILWPAPHRFIAFDIDNFGYQDKIIFPIDAVPESSDKPLELHLKLDLLVCKDLCVPESHQLTLTVPTGQARLTDDQNTRANAMRHIPSTSGEDLFSIDNVWVDESTPGTPTFHAFGHAAAEPAAGADLFVENDGSVSVGAPTLSYTPSTRELRVDAPIRSGGNLDNIKKHLGNNGVTLTYVSGDASYERRAALGGGAATTATAGAALRGLVNTTQQHADLSILFMAFLGGLILNLMPCMLPVLSIKILSVLSHGGKDHRVHRWTIFRNFMASTAGIVFSFWIIAGVLVALKEAGATIGWGIQFQHPGFLVFMIAVLLLFAASMWGLFEIPLPRFIAKNIPLKHEHEPTVLGHFLTGAFATLLATPCTAPFLGTVIGFALSREAFDIFLVFTFLGLGLAFPYIVLALSPRFFKYMPKPGAWMVTMKKVLAVAITLTAAWLINVLVTVTTQPTLDDGWTAFDEALIMPAVKDGRTVVVDVTADWCLTCKANKRLVFDQKDVEDAIYAPNVLRLQADWTHHDEKISAYLKKYGRYGIPFNIVYGPGAPDGIVLSELPRKKDVMAALEEAAGE